MTRKCGFVALMGAPNVGKSTLVNRLVGEKISIVTHKAQTTRLPVRGIFMQGEAQVIMVDTPGIFEAKKRLDRAMIHAASSSLREADAALHVLDAAVGIRPIDLKIIEQFKESKGVVIGVLNKADRLKEKERLLPLIKDLAELYPYEGIFPISALKDKDLDKLKTTLAGLVPSGPWMFEAEQLSDMPLQITVSEVVREKILMLVHEEIPYELAVLPESWENFKDGSVHIRQVIVVRKDSQKPVVLGQNGSRIKEIRVQAQKDLEKILAKKIHLFLEVKVDANWTEKPLFYQTFGLQGEL